MLKAREKSSIQGAIGFGFAFHWLKNSDFLNHSLTVAVAIA